MTQDQLAEKIGKDSQAIQRYERGAVNPGYLALLDIAKGLEVSVSELLNF